MARVGVFDGRNVLFCDVSSGLLHERGMKAPLGVARLLDRMNLRAQVVGAQEIVGDPEPSGRVAL